MFLSTRSAKRNRSYSLIKMSKTADFNTLLYMVGGYSQGRVASFKGGANAPPPLNITLAGH